MPAAGATPMPDPFRVVAIIAAYNEGDIISATIEHLVENGVHIYLIDNASTDDTADQARRWLGRGVLDIESFPAAPGSRSEGRDLFDWTAILRRKEALARDLEADWFIHHDADEFRESPWPGMTLGKAIEWVDRLGFNAIDFRVFNFPPIDDGFVQGTDPRTYFTHWEEAAEYDRVQAKAWKATGAPVALAESGGHDVRFAGRRTFPVPFLLRHYPIRSQTHGRRKVFGERQGRFREDELARGWHVQYHSIDDEETTFLRDPADLRPFDLDRARLECMLPDAMTRNLAERLLRADTQLDALKAKVHQAMERLADQRDHAGNLEHQRDELRLHAANLEDELATQRRHAANLEKELVEQRLHAGNLEKELVEQRLHAGNLEQLRDELQRHSDNLLRERDGLTARIVELESDRDAALAQVPARGGTWGDGPVRRLLDLLRRR
jgi:hypothetical protein